MPLTNRMDATIAKLEYTLKDMDVGEMPLLTLRIQEVVDGLKGVMAMKRRRWAEEEMEMGDCPCGCSKKIDGGHTSSSKGVEP